MYVFYGELDSLNKIKEAADNREREIRYFDPNDLDSSSKEKLIDFLRKNERKVEVLTFLELGREELISLSGEMEKKFPDIPQIGVISESEEFDVQNTGLDGLDIVEKEERLVSSLFKKIDELFLKEKSEELKKIIASSEEEIAIFIHDNPDPDAIASAMVLEDICGSEGVEAKTYYGGSIGHPENEIFLENTDFVLQKLEERDVPEVIKKSEKIAFVDFAEASSNNILPKDVEPDLIIDHHYTSRDISTGEYNEIRSDMGATSTIMTKHIQNLDLKVDPLLAAALLFGIKVDTDDYTKNISTADYKVISYLSAIADKDILDILKSPPIHSETLDAMGRAISNRDIEGSVLTSFSGKISHPDDISRIADLLLRERDISTVLVYGIKDKKIHMSARSKDLQINVGRIMDRAYSDIGEGGGHEHAAGGMIPLEEFDDEKEAAEKIADLFKDELWGK
ncbi:MAG: DHH family phosphoesterase [Candidatus Thermoplasmatota archaeon]|nr:DHH family phosphoesterase [Candidatus Thermoplasmatota archaeon]